MTEVRRAEQVTLSLSLDPWALAQEAGAVAQPEITCSPQPLSGKEGHQGQGGLASSLQVSPFSSGTPWTQPHSGSRVTCCPLTSG